MNKLIYLASPYSKYPQGRYEAYAKVCKKAAELMVQGELVFCPIAHSHPIEEIGMEGHIQEGDFWLTQDFAVLSKCDAIYVYKMPGWEESYGVGKEIEFAKDRGIPISYIEYD